MIVESDYYQRDLLDKNITENKKKNKDSNIDIDYAASSNKCTAYSVAQTR